jgi:peptide deformylase
MTVPIARSALIRVRYLDRRGRDREQTFSWSLGACIQHEIDHLDGVTIADRARYQNCRRTAATTFIGRPE